MANFRAWQIENLIIATLLFLIAAALLGLVVLR